jgi:hypothetical protein
MFRLIGRWLSFARQSSKIWTQRDSPPAKSPVRSDLRSAPFFITYPFNSPLAISAADIRGLVEPRLKVFYSRVPKAANTSVVFTLEKLRTGVAPDSVKIKRNFRRPSQLSEDEVRALDSYFKFTFVRDPFTRVLSAYLSKVVPGAIVPPRLRGGATPTFADFCEFLRDGGLHENAHWAPQTSLLLMRPGQFDFIGKVEQFDRDIRVVLDRLGGSADSIVYHSSRPTQAAQHMDEFYDERSRSLVRDLYREDFAAFGY